MGTLLLHYLQPDQPCMTPKRCDMILKMWHSCDIHTFTKYRLFADKLKYINWVSFLNANLCFNCYEMKISQFNTSLLYLLVMIKLDSAPDSSTAHKLSL